MKKMQEEAVRRVKEMHSRSKFSDSPPEKPHVQPNVGYQKNKGNSNFNLRNTKTLTKLQTKDHTPPPKQKGRGFFGGLPNIVDALFRDEEKTLILILLVLLMDDEENFMILLVLLYLLM